MSKLFRVLVALLTALGGSVMILVAPSSDKALYFYLIGGVGWLVTYSMLVPGLIADLVHALIAVAVMVSGLVFFVWTLEVWLAAGLPFDRSMLSPVQAFGVWVMLPALYLWRLWLDYRTQARVVPSGVMSNMESPQQVVEFSSSSVFKSKANPTELEP